MDTANRPLERSSDERTDEQLQLPADLVAVDKALGTMPSRRPDALAVDAVVAAAMNAGIRMLYNEDAPDTLPAQIEAETVGLAPLVAALDNLPTRKPNAHAVDTIMAAATHSGIRELYGEEEVGLQSERESQEAARLAPVVTALDNLLTRRPNDASVAAVMAAAAGSARVDRPLVRGKRRMPVWTSAIAAVLLIGFSTFWIITSSTFTQESVLVAQIEEALPAPPSVTERDEPPARPLPADESALAIAEPAAPSGMTRSEVPTPRSRPASRPVQTAAVTVEQPVEESRLADESDDALRVLYLHLDAMQNDDLAWDEPEFELGGDAASAPSTRNHGWMQVRVDR